MQYQPITKKSAAAPVELVILPSFVKLLESVRKEFDADREVAKALHGAARDLRMAGIVGANDADYQ